MMWVISLGRQPARMRLSNTAPLQSNRITLEPISRRYPDEARRGCGSGEPEQCTVSFISLATTSVPTFVRGPTLGEFRFVPRADDDPFRQLPAFATGDTAVGHGRSGVMLPVPATRAFVQETAFTGAGRIRAEITQLSGIGLRIVEHPSRPLRVDLFPAAIEDHRKATLAEGMV